MMTCPPRRRLRIRLVARPALRASGGAMTCPALRLAHQTEAWRRQRRRWRTHARRRLERQLRPWRARQTKCRTTTTIAWRPPRKLHRTIVLHGERWMMRAPSHRRRRWRTDPSPAAGPQRTSHGRCKSQLLVEPSASEPAARGSCTRPSTRPCTSRRRPASPSGRAARAPGPGPCSRAPPARRRGAHR